MAHPAESIQKITHNWVYNWPKGSSHYGYRSCISWSDHSRSIGWSQLYRYGSPGFQTENALGPPSTWWRKSSCATNPRLAPWVTLHSVTIEFGRVLQNYRRRHLLMEEWTNILQLAFYSISEFAECDTVSLRATVETSENQLIQHRNSTSVSSNIAAQACLEA